jgi:hypothetical protein
MDVAEITYLLADWLAACGWPPDMRIFARRRRLADGEQPTLFAADGYKFSAFVTNTTGLGHQLLDARHRQHARVEDDVRTTKHTGLSHFPSKFWEANLGWAQAICIGVDLLAWLKLLGDLPPRPAPRRTRHAAPPATAHPGPDHPRTAPAPAPATRALALVEGPGPRDHHHRLPPPTGPDLTSQPIPTPTSRRKGNSTSNRPTSPAGHLVVPTESTPTRRDFHEPVLGYGCQRCKLRSTHSAASTTTDEIPLSACSSPEPTWQEQIFNVRN